MASLMQSSSVSSHNKNYLSILWDCSKQEKNFGVLSPAVFPTTLFTCHMIKKKKKEKNIWNQSSSPQFVAFLGSSLQFKLCTLSIFTIIIFHANFFFSNGSVQNQNWSYSKRLVSSFFVSLVGWLVWFCFVWLGFFVGGGFMFVSSKNILCFCLFAGLLLIW